MGGGDRRGVAAGFIVGQIKQARTPAQEQTAARNVRVALVPPWEWNKPAKKMRLMDAAVFQTGLPTMPPGWQVALAMEFVKDLLSRTVAIRRAKEPTMHARDTHDDVGIF